MHRISVIHRTTLTVILVASVAGCAPEMARLRQSITHPGPAAYQRAEAIQHDPYLLDDVGPEVVGARPREYQRPLNEVERARLAASPPANMPVLAAPGVMVAPAPIPAPIYSAPSPPTVSPYPAAPPAVSMPAPAPAPFPTQQRAPY